MATVREQRYELTAVDEVRPHPDNAKLGDTDAIGRSIDRSGFYGSLVVQRSTGYILVGNHRWRAAREKGLAELPVIFVDCDADEARRIMVSDNRTADLGTYDDAKLVALLSAFDGDLEGTGYSDDELAALLDSLEEPNPDMPSPHDERYTPDWIFDGMGLVFDLDVAAPVDPALRTTPARRHLCIHDDGLTAAWEGLVWMNPPFSATKAFAERWTAHPDGVCLLPVSNSSYVVALVERAACFVFVPGIVFETPLDQTGAIGFPTFMAAQGAGEAGLRRLAEVRNWPCCMAETRPRPGIPFDFPKAS